MIFTSQNTIPEKNLSGTPQLSFLMRSQIVLLNKSLIQKFDLKENDRNLIGYEDNSLYLILTDQSDVLGIQLKIKYKTLGFNLKASAMIKMGIKNEKKAEYKEVTAIPSPRSFKTETGSIEYKQVYKIR